MEALAIAMGKTLPADAILMFGTTISEVKRDTADAEYV